MKRMLQFKKTDEGYACFENDSNIFEISMSDLQFDVKAFYQAFYGADKDFENIEVENCVQDDKNARRVFECITQLMKKINEKLAELPDEDVQNNDDVLEKSNIES